MKIESVFGAPKGFEGKEEILWHFLVDEAESSYNTFMEKYRVFVRFKDQEKVLRFERGTGEPVILLGRFGRLPSGIDVFVGAKLDLELVSAVGFLRIRLPGNIFVSVTGVEALVEMPLPFSGREAYSTQPVTSKREKMMTGERFDELMHYVTMDNSFLREVQRAMLSGQTLPRPEFVENLRAMIRRKLEAD